VTVTGRVRAEPAAARRVEPDWVHDLTAQGPAHDAALVELHALLLRASRHQVWRMRGQLPVAGADRLDDIAHQSADEAMVALLAKLASFEGRSRFSTWAFKFAILQASTEVRREAWRHREVQLPESVVVLDPGPSTEQYAEGAELVRALTTAIETVLTPHQRRIALALLVEEIPIDVLAERLGSTRNALYKTLHDARGKLRSALVEAGLVPEPSGRRSR
jgi:RNA polymerase sigma-70 factor, ECF subfamily